jgi:GntR family transcriptional regulator / MocR family aminotransferase
MTTAAYLTSFIKIDGTLKTPLHLQVYESLHRAITSGQLTPGTQLPSSRDLAELIQVSRNTVLNAFDQLIAEGYLETNSRQGTFVTSYLPEAFIHSPDKREYRQAPASEILRLSEHGQRMAAVKPHQIRQGNAHNIFTNGIPALAHFPFELWAKLTARHYRYSPLSLFDETIPAAGYEPLREAVAEHLRVARSVNCEADQVIITSGSQQGFYLAANLLLDPGDTVWMEEPGCMGPRAAFLACGATLVPVPVDEHGTNVEAGIERAPEARVAYINPSHHYPLGVTMSLARRYQLLEWAARQHAWIIEDDYDSEFRYVGRPLPSVQGQDTHGLVIYIGTFSKTLFPGLRLGYMVVPKPFARQFAAARAVIDKYPHIINQMVLTDFITEGHFYRHLRKMRRLYNQRRMAMIDLLQKELSDIITLGPSDTGMHICGYLPDDIADHVVAGSAAQRGIEVLPLSEFYIGDEKRNGIILGYTAIPEEHLASGVELLKQSILEQHR